MKSKMIRLYEHSFTEYIHWEITENAVHQLFIEVTLVAAQMIIPIMVVVAVAGVAANMIQIGFLFTAESVKVDLKRISPIQGAKKIFSLRAVVELLKSLLKIAFIGTITFMSFWFFKNNILRLFFKDIDIAFTFFDIIT